MAAGGEGDWEGAAVRIYSARAYPAVQVAI